MYAMAINFHQLKAYIKHYFFAKRNGHGIHSPFAYTLCEEVFYNANYFYDFVELKKIRDLLLNNTTEFIIEDYGAGSKAFRSNKRTITELVKKGTSTTKQSEILYKLINFLNCSNSVELGTSIGLNTLYMARANRNGCVTSIEGSKSLKEFAEALSKKHKTENTSFIHSTFDKALPELLKNTNQLDLLYVDGNHTYEATLNYFKLALSKRNNETVFIFDDIYWSKEMTKAWEEIKQHHLVTLSIDAFYFGLIFFREEIKEKIDIRLIV